MSVDTDDDFITALHNSDIKYVKKYIKNGGDINTFDVEGNPPLIIVMNNENDTLFNLLLPLVDINLPGEGNLTPLMVAILQNRQDYVEDILNRNPNLYAIDYNDKTAFDYAYETGVPEIIELLEKTEPPYTLTRNDILQGCSENNRGIIIQSIKHGRDVNAFNIEDKSRNTCIHRALLNGKADTRLFKLFYDNRFVFDQTNDKYETPLMIAIRMHEDSLIKPLLRYGSNPLYQNELKQNAVDKAFEYNNSDALELLKKFLKVNMGYDDNIIQLILSLGQEITPKTLTGESYPRSKRARTRMKRLLPRSPLRYSNENIILLNNFSLNEFCFCLEYPTGYITTTTGIPVTRYGSGETYGYYSDEPVLNAEYTWYYVEPDSDLYLISNSVYVARNKIAMYIALNLETNSAFFDIEIGERIKKKMRKELRNDNYDYKDLINSNEVNIDENWTNYFRNPKTGDIAFEGGMTDFLDKELWSLARKIGIEVLVFTHQPGNYGRLVAECLDVRNRRTSLESIVINEPIKPQTSEKIKTP